MPTIEYNPNSLALDQTTHKKDEKEKLQCVVSTTSIDTGHVSEIEDIADWRGENPFLDSEVTQHWADVYNNCNYEGRHAFDPTMTWTNDEEKKVIRKLDWHVCLWAVSMSSYFVELHTDKFSSASCTSRSRLTVGTSARHLLTDY